MTELPAGALESWFQRTEAVDGSQVAPLSLVATPIAQNEHPEVTEMRSELELVRATAALQRDPAWLDLLDDEEQHHERAAVRTVRRMRRKQLVASAKATDRLAGRERRAEQNLAQVGLTDRIWQARALARRTRLLDPTSRLAAVQKVQTVSSLVLLTMAAAGISWTSAGVHDALVGPDGSALAYIVEPLFCLPLLVIMAVQAIAAQWGRRFPEREHRRKVYLLETCLLVATIAINSAPVLPVVGHWKDTTTLLAHLVPPALIVVAVVLQPMVSGFLSGILADAHLDVSDPGRRRLEAETVDVLVKVGKIQRAMTSGDVEIQPGTGRPSNEGIRRYFNCEKRRAQGVGDALDLLMGNDQTTTRELS